MIQTRYKTLLPFGILAAVGVTSPTFSNIQSFPRLSFSGGGISSIKNTLSTYPQPKNLDLSRQNIKNLEKLDHSAQIVSKNLEVQTSQLIDSQNFRNKLDIEKPSKNVLNIYSETKKESEAQKIDTQLLSKVDSIRKRIKPRDLAEFILALRKVKNFDRSKGSFSPRGKSPPQQIQKLLVSEKQRISDFFAKFEALSREQSSFSDKLTKLSGDINPSRLRDSTCISCIPVALKKIGWNNQELNIFEVRSSFKNNPISPYMYYHQRRAFPDSLAKSTWGTWSSTNPYYDLFHSENDWLSYVRRISQSWSSYYSYMNNPSRMATSFFTLGAAGSRDKGKLEREIEDSKSSLELSIATRLMSLMKQLD